MTVYTKSILPVTVVVCTLNEEENIGECLDSIAANHPAEIWVIDGNSNDKTAEIVKSKGVNIRNSPVRGLVHQRHLGLSLATQPYFAFVDADDVLDPDCLQILLKELELNGYAAIQALSRSYSQSTYVERAMDSVSRLGSRSPGPTKMVGRPALHRTAILREVGIDLNWGKSYNEDTDLSIRHELKNYKLGIGTGFSRRKHPKTFAAWLKKWRNYGWGDAQIIRKHPSKRKAILKHQLVNYPILMSWEAVQKGYGRYFPFYICFGLFRFVFMVQALIFYRKNYSPTKRSG